MPIPSQRPAQPFISCVVPAYNEAEGIAAFVAALTTTLAAITPKYEIVVVNDGSRDHTAQVVADLCASNPALRFINLSRNFGKEAALTAGIDHVSGEVAVLIDADFQHPLATIAEFVQRWQAGYDMVYGVRDSRADESAIKRAGANLFYRLLNWLSTVDIPPDAGDFRLLDRKVIDALKAMPERGRFMKGLYAWVGFPSVAVPFVVQERETGETSFGIGGLLRLAQTGIVAFSDVPLRVWSIVGIVVSAISLGYAAWIVFATLAFGVDVPGWATLIVAMMFLGGIQLLSIGILGEYLAGVFNEVKQRPTYLVAQRLGFEQTDKTE
ncbi:glycosyltransferase family 2 protein [Chitinimonas sp.]|uniref:glycosyltransferase family 2 protein n=1 Tax=Chitinimonas sp. TaxID=1934313 RepID=UPI0035AF1072